MNDTDILDIRRAFRLTLSEAALVACMLDGEPASDGKLRAALIRLDGLTYRGDAAKVMLSYARRKLERYGVVIRKGNRASGPRIDAANIKTIRGWVATRATQLGARQ